MLKKTLIIPLIISLFVASTILFLSKNGSLTRLESAALDFSLRLRDNQPTNSKIVIIEITDSDILGIGRWPWSRSWYSDMARALTEFGAKYIYFDMILSEPSTEEEDSLLEEKIKSTKNIYLPFTFLGHSLDFNSAFMPIKRFYSNLKGTGAQNIYPDIDGTVRRMPLVFLTDNGLYPQIALKIAMDYTGSDIQDIQSDSLVLSGPEGEIKIPLVDKNTMLINWYGRWQNTFKRHAFLNVLTAFKNSLEDKKPEINLDDFKGSICLVAVTAVGIGDIKSVPIQPEYPQIGIIATALSNILDQRFILYVPAWLNILILYFLALLPALFLRGERPIKEAVIIICIGLVYILLNALLFFKNNTVMNSSCQLLGLLLSSFIIGSYDFIRVSVERKYFLKMSVTDGLTGLFNIRYFKTILENEILHAKVDLSRGFCIVMTDIDHFKKFNDTYGHQVGDLVLKEVAVVLKGSVRSGDFVARYGGEEMIILLRGTHLQRALVIAEKIRSNVELHLVQDQNNTYKVTISLGVANFIAGDLLDTIIKRADTALYKAKEMGRNRVSSS